MDLDDSTNDSEDSIEMEFAKSDSSEDSNGSQTTGPVSEADSTENSNHSSDVARERSLSCSSTASSVVEPNSTNHDFAVPKTNHRSTTDRRKSPRSLSVQQYINRFVVPTLTDALRSLVSKADRPSTREALRFIGQFLIDHSNSLDGAVSRDTGVVNRDVESTGVKSTGVKSTGVESTSS